MKTADLSNVCKPFPIAKYWASAITEEFFYQGDLEKAEGLDGMFTCNPILAAKCSVRRVLH